MWNCGSFTTNWDVGCVVATHAWLYLSVAEGNWSPATLLLPYRNAPVDELAPAKLRPSKENTRLLTMSLNASCLPVSVQSGSLNARSHVAYGSDFWFGKGRTQRPFRFRPGLDHLDTLDRLRSVNSGTNIHIPTVLFARTGELAKVGDFI